jgi:hypothetical protein
MNIWLLLLDKDGGFMLLSHVFGSHEFLRQKMELINTWDALLKKLVGLSIIGKGSFELIDCWYNYCKYLSLYSYDQEMINFW